jgi:hypothetical protein
MIKPTTPKRITGNAMMIIEIADKFGIAKDPCPEERINKTKRMPKIKIPQNRGIQIVQKGLTF